MQNLIDLTHLDNAFFKCCYFTHPINTHKHVFGEFNHLYKVLRQRPAKFLASVMMISIFWFHTGVLTNILLINLSISIPNKFDKSKENRQIICRRSYRCSTTKRCSTRRSNINALIQTNDNHSLCFASIPALIVYHSSNINTP
jgi:hypothetical protein